MKSTSSDNSVPDTNVTCKANREEDEEESAKSDETGWDGKKGGLVDIPFNAMDSHAA